MARRNYSQTFLNSYLQILNKTPKPVCEPFNSKYPILNQNLFIKTFN